MSRKDLLENLYVYGGYTMVHNILYPECGFTYGNGIYQAEKITKANYIWKYHGNENMGFAFEKFSVYLTDDLALEYFEDIQAEGGYLLEDNKIVPYCNLRWDIISCSILENTTFYSLAKHERMQPILHNAIIGKYTVTGDY